MTVRPKVVAIFGSEDVLVRRYFESAQELLDGLDNGSELHIVPNAGHWVQFEAADTVDELLCRALDVSGHHPDARDEDTG